MTISNQDDIISLQDVRRAISDLNDEIEGLQDDIESDAGWVEDQIKESEEELQILKELEKDMEDYRIDYLIHEDYFTEYAEQLASDMGDIEYRWPFTCIDWEQAAKELKQDYTEVDFDGQAYFGR